MKALNIKQRYEKLVSSLNLTQELYDKYSSLFKEKFNKSKEELDKDFFFKYERTKYLDLSVRLNNQLTKKQQLEAKYPFLTK